MLPSSREEALQLTAVAEEMLRVRPLATSVSPSLTLVLTVLAFGLPGALSPYRKYMQPIWRHRSEADL